MKDDTPFVGKIYGFTDRAVTPNSWGNNFIRERILNSIPFAAAKIGGIECSALQEYFRKDNLADWFKPMHWDTLADAMYNNAGIFPKKMESLTRWAELFSSSLSTMDLLAVWNPQYQEDLIIANWAQDSDLTTMRALEPFYHEKPWSSALKSKKVLVISPFTSTIEKQYGRREEIWPNHDQFILPEFELITLKCPLSPALQEPLFVSWEATLSNMCEKISEIEFDVALVGAGAYSIPLCDFIKRENRSSVHVGGGLQILFGIKGNRWLEHEIISGFFNEAWVFPSSEETPANSNVVEGACYWGSHE